jgi:hypothetical protein
MTLPREPRLHPIPITQLRPTQITVGMREVEAKRKSWREHHVSTRAEFLGRHLIPVVMGPKQQFYVIDHHHLSLALYLEGVEVIATTVVADVSRLDRDAFWIFLDNRGWMHPFDAKGRRRPYEDLPKKISALIDDPYRSLAGAVRLAGGFAKDTTPFSEFLWADFLRRRIKRDLVNAHFNKALTQSLQLAKSLDANFLPGWCGPIERD